MKILDSHIRATLLKRLSQQGSTEPYIAEEVAISRGLAIADVVAFFKEPHCFEIKSDYDSLKRLQNQSTLFSKNFPKLTLITGPKHTAKAIDIIPSYWGIIEANGTPEKIALTYIRKCSKNPDFERECLLTTIWNDELKKIISNKKLKCDRSLGRSELSRLLAKNISNIESFELVSNFHLQKSNFQIS